MSAGIPLIGLGFDAHRLGRTPPLMLAGVVVDRSLGLEATSDGDVAAHAVADAVLGAAALGDMGTFFPSGEARWEGADSMDLLRGVVGLAASEGMTVGNVDLTVIAETVRPRIVARCAPAWRRSWASTRFACRSRPPPPTGWGSPVAVRASRRGRRCCW